MFEEVTSYTDAVEKSRRKKLDSLLNNPNNRLKLNNLDNAERLLQDDPEVASSIEDAFYRLGLARRYPLDSNLPELRNKEIIERLDACIIFILSVDPKVPNDAQINLDLNNILYIIASPKLLPILNHLITLTQAVKILTWESKKPTLSLYKHVLETTKCAIDVNSEVPDFQDVLIKLREDLRVTRPLTKINFLPFSLMTTFDCRPRFIPNHAIYFHLISETEAVLLSKANAKDAWYLFKKEYLIEDENSELDSPEKARFELLKSSKEDYVFTIAHKNEVSVGKMSHLQSQGILIYETQYYWMIACRNEGEYKNVNNYCKGKKNEFVLSKTLDIPVSNQPEIKSLPQTVTERIDLLRNVFFKMSSALINRIQYQLFIIEELLIKNFEVILIENHYFNFESLEKYFKFIDDVIFYIAQNIFSSGSVSKLSDQIKVRNRISTLIMSTFLKFHIIYINSIFTELFEIILNHVLSKEIFFDKDLKAFDLLKEVQRMDLLITSCANERVFIVRHAFSIKILKKTMLQFYNSICGKNCISNEKNSDAINIFIQIIIKMCSSDIYNQANLSFNDSYLEMLLFLILRAGINQSVNLPSENIEEIKAFLSTRVKKFADSALGMAKNGADKNPREIIENQMQLLKTMILKLIVVFFVGDMNSVIAILNSFNSYYSKNLGIEPLNYDPYSVENKKFCNDHKISHHFFYQLHKFLILLKMIKEKTTDIRIKALANRKKTLELKRNDRPIFVKNYLEILHRTTPRGALTKLEILLCNNELTPEVLDIKVPEEVEDPAYENWIQELLKPKSSLTKKTIDLENTLRELIRLQPQIIQISFDICSASILFNFSSPMKKQFENPIFMKFEKNDVFVDKREEEKHFKVEINEQTFGVIKEIKVFFEKFELVQKFFIHYGFSDFAVNDDLTEVSIDAGKVSIKINDHEIPINNFISALNDLGIQVTFKDKKLWIDVSLRKTNEIKTALDRDAIKLLNGKLYEGVKSPKKNDERTLPRSTSQFFKPEKNHGNTSHNGLARTTSFYLKQKNSETAEQKYESNTVLTAKSKRASRQISVPLPELIDKSISIEVADKVFYLNPNYLRTVQLETNPVIYIFMLRENEIRNSMKKDPMDVLINPFRKDLKPSSDIDLTKAMDHFSRKLCKPLIGSDREYKFKLTIVFEGKKISTTDVPYTFELCSSGKERVFCISLTTNHPQNPLIIPIYYSDKGLHDKNTISNIVSQGMTLDLTQYASLEPYNADEKSKSSSFIP